MTKEEIIEQLKGILCGDREVNYGNPEDNFATIAEFWSVYLMMPIEAIDVAALMTLMKIARLSNNPEHLDSWLDVSGYGVCGYQIAEKTVESSKCREPWQDFRASCD